jgi:pilus assembly protein CpaC
VLTRRDRADGADSVGKSTVLRPTSPVTRILLGNPENARAARPAETDGKKDEGGGKGSAGADTRPGVADVDVLLLAPTEVYLLGKTIGSTNVVMLDRSGTCTAFDVVVGMDTTALQSVLGQLMPAEKDIKVSSAFDSIVLSGTVSDSEALVRVTDLAKRLVRGGDGKAEPAHRQHARGRRTAAGDARGQGGRGLEGAARPVRHRLLARLCAGRWLDDAFPVGHLRRLCRRAWPDQRHRRERRAIQFGRRGSRRHGADPGVSGGNVTVTYDSAGRPTYTTTYGTVPGRNVSNTTLNMQKTDGVVKVLAEPTVMAISGTDRQLPRRAARSSSR